MGNFTSKRAAKKRPEAKSHAVIDVSHPLYRLPRVLAKHILSSFLSLDELLPLFLTSHGTAALAGRIFSELRVLDGVMKDGTWPTDNRFLLTQMLKHCKEVTEIDVSSWGEKFTRFQKGYFKLLGTWLGRMVKQNRKTLRKVSAWNDAYPIEDKLIKVILTCPNLQALPTYSSTRLLAKMSTKKWPPLRGLCVYSPLYEKKPFRAAVSALPLRNLFIDLGPRSNAALEIIGLLPLLEWLCVSTSDESKSTFDDVIRFMTKLGPLLATMQSLSVLTLECFRSRDDTKPNAQAIERLQWHLPTLLKLNVFQFWMPQVHAPNLEELSFSAFTTKQVLPTLAKLTRLRKLQLEIRYEWPPCEDCCSEFAELLAAGRWPALTSLTIAHTAKRQNQREVEYCSPGILHALARRPCDQHDGVAPLIAVRFSDCSGYAETYTYVRDLLRRQRWLEQFGFELSWDCRHFEGPSFPDLSDIYHVFLPNLRAMTLDVASDELFRSLSFPHMTHLRLATRFVRLRNLDAVFSSCPALQHLIISSGVFIADLSAPALRPPIRDLQWSNNWWFQRSDPAPLVCALRGLKRLYVSEVDLSLQWLAELAEGRHFDHLQYLGLGRGGMGRLFSEADCRSLKRIVLACPLLTRLDLAQFVGFSDGVPLVHEQRLEHAMRRKALEQWIEEQYEKGATKIQLDERDVADDDE